MTPENLEAELIRRTVEKIKQSPEWRAILAQEERLILYGDSTKAVPKGILNA